MKFEIKKEKYHQGRKSKFFTIKAKCDGINVNITYDCNSENIIIHEWYRFNNCQLENIQTEVKTRFKNKAEK